MKPELKQEIDIILCLMLEDAASDQQIARLNTLQENDPEVLEYSVDFYLVAAVLRKSNCIPLAFFDTQREIDEQFNQLKIFAAEEYMAPAIDAPDEDPQENLRCVNDAERLPVIKADRSKAALFVMISSIAAALLFFVSIRLVPEREEVAVVAETINSAWGSGSEVFIGDSFYNTDEAKVLEAGVIEVEFNYGARVVIEAPAKFSCKSGNLIDLEYGRAYSRVPKEATGFTIVTEDARVVDLGTEFGVQVNVDGTVELHVTKGKTSLIAGHTKKQQDVFEVLAGQARHVSDLGTSVQEIELKDTAFAQHIDTKTGMIWNGRKTINLADIVGGGNGFNTGQVEHGIDPGTGEAIVLGPEHTYEVPSASNAYHVYKTNPFVDGVFVPNAADGTQIVSSLGHVFSECPKTNGHYFARIINGTTQAIGGGGPGLSLNNVFYGTPENPAIFMHTNQAITFDLAAIRKALQGAEMARFRSICGVSQTAVDFGLADVTVLVDGQIRFNRKNIQKGQSSEIDVPLGERDRFLTLLTTISEGKQVPEGYNREHGDWCLFGRPTLDLE